MYGKIAWFLQQPLRYRTRSSSGMLLYSSTSSFILYFWLITLADGQIKAIWKSSASITTCLWVIWDQRRKERDRLWRRSIRCLPLKISPVLFLNLLALITQLSPYSISHSIQLRPLRSSALNKCTSTEQENRKEWNEISTWEWKKGNGSCNWWEWEKKLYLLWKK